jgi:hypothetical protein
MMAKKATQFVAGFTTDPQQFLHLGEKAREAGFKNIDSTMPFPVHGFEEAYGYKGSWIGLAAFGALLTGWAAGFSMQTWMLNFDYPINIGGKPHVSWPAFVPVIFECGILFAAITTLLSLIIAAKLRPNPMTDVVNDRLTHDLFSIVLPFTSEEEKTKAEAFLKEQNVSEIEVHDLELLDPRYIKG